MPVLAIDHPLVQHHLASLRDTATTPGEFRRCVTRLAQLLAVEATLDLPLAATRVRTPICETDAARVSVRLGIIPILRAGLGMVDPVLHLLPDAEVWHLGLYRDEATLRPVEYYQKLPPGRPVDVAMVIDPMLATGGSAIAALETLARWGVPQCKVLALIAAPEGLRAIEKAHPNAQIYVCSIDERLNEHGYIVPGLGDAGDRTFNTLAR